MSSKHQISRDACARYAKTHGAGPQSEFRMELNLFILKGHSVPDAETSALRIVRGRYPGFVPVPAAPVPVG